MNDEMTAEIERLRAERDALAAFKSWTHAYLDARGIPAQFPDSPHSKEGCRIGDRMDAVFAERDAARALAARLAEFLVKGESLVDQIECLAIYDYPHLYEAAKRWRGGVKVVIAALANDRAEGVIP